MFRFGSFQSKMLMFRRTCPRILSPSGADLLWHGNLWWDRTRPKDQVWCTAQPHWRHHGTPHWILYHERCWGQLLSAQVKISFLIKKNYGNHHHFFQAGQLVQNKDKVSEPFDVKEAKRQRGIIMTVDVFELNSFVSFSKSMLHTCTVHNLKYISQTHIFFIKWYGALWIAKRKYC